MKEVDVHFLDPEPRERSLELVGEKLRVDAMPASVGVLHHLREGSSALLARLGHRKRLPLYVADLGDDNDLFATMAGKHVSDAGLTRSVGVVGGRVDEIDAAQKRLFQGRSVLRRPIVDPVAAEAE